jgi:hypothetical protein
VLRRGAIPSFRLDSENWQKAKPISDPKTSLVILSSELSCRALVCIVGVWDRATSPAPVGMRSRMHSRASGAVCLDAFFAVSANARNMPLVGPNLQLVPDVDPADGWFDVMWIEGKERKALQDYLELCRRDERASSRLSSTTSV